MTTPRSLIACLAIIMCAGCSGVTVVKDPSEYDTGIRYWRPKPYLLVTPADATGRMVNIKLQYLPDFSEEYSIRPKGRKPPAVALKDGWNLVAVGGPPPPPDPVEPAAIPASPTDPTKLPEYVVAATNVPMGYYESVFDKSRDGTKKTLKGWRYIGLSPIAGGDAIGVDSKTAPGCPPTSSSSISGPLYGMVFFNGVMTFRQLDEIANNQTCPQYVKLVPDKPAPPVPPAPLINTKPVENSSGPATNPIPTPVDVDDKEPAPAAPPVTRPVPGAALNEPNLEVIPVTPATPSPNPGPAAMRDLAPTPEPAQDAEVARTSISIPKPKIWNAVR